MHLAMYLEAVFVLDGVFIFRRQSVIGPALNDAVDKQNGDVSGDAV